MVELQNRRSIKEVFHACRKAAGSDSASRCGCEVGEFAPGSSCACKNLTSRFTQRCQKKGPVFAHETTYLVNIQSVPPRSCTPAKAWIRFLQGLGHTLWMRCVSVSNKFVAHREELPALFSVNSQTLQHTHHHTHICKGVKRVRVRACTSVCVCVCRNTVRSVLNQLGS